MKIPIFTLCLLYAFSSYSISKKYIVSLSAVSISALGIYGLIQAAKKPEPFIPTNEKINTVTVTASNKEHDHTIEQLIAKVAKRKTPDKAIVFLKEKNIKVQKGVNLSKNDNTVFLISRGYMRSNTPGCNDNYIQHGGGLMTAYAQIKDQLVTQFPCITFDYPDNRAHYSFGQEIDVLCLEYVYQQIVAHNPQANIVLIGDCRGAKSALEFLTKKPNNIKALVLLSPFTNVWELTQQIAHNYVGWLPSSDKIIYHFFNLYYPNYFPEKETLVERLHTINPELTIFIGHRKNDKVIPNSCVFNLIDLLERNGHSHLHVLLTDDTQFKHSRMTGIKEVQKAVKEFFGRYGVV